MGEGEGIKAQSGTSNRACITRQSARVGLGLGMGMEMEDGDGKGRGTQRGGAGDECARV